MSKREEKAQRYLEKNLLEIAEVLNNPTMDYKVKIGILVHRLEIPREIAKKLAEERE
jgi:hypothetical protein